MHTAPHTYTAVSMMPYGISATKAASHKHMNKLLRRHFHGRHADSIRLAPLVLTVPGDSVFLRHPPYGVLITYGGGECVSQPEISGCTFTKTSAQDAQVVTKASKYRDWVRIAALPPRTYQQNCLMASPVQYVRHHVRRAVYARLLDSRHRQDPEYAWRASLHCLLHR